MQSSRGVHPAAPTASGGHLSLPPTGAERHADVFGTRAGPTGLPHGQHALRLQAGHGGHCGGHEEGEHEHNSVQSLDPLGRCDSAEILFKSFLQEAIMSSSGTAGDVYSLTLSIQRFLC